MVWFTSCNIHLSCISVYTERGNRNVCRTLWPMHRIRQVEMHLKIYFQKNLVKFKETFFSLQRQLKKYSDLNLFGCVGSTQDKFCAYKIQVQQFYSTLTFLWMQRPPTHQNRWTGWPWPGSWPCQSSLCPGRNVGKSAAPASQYRWCGWRSVGEEAKKNNVHKFRNEHC